MPSDVRIVINVDGQKRDFLLHVPDRPMRQRPLIVMFHGTGGAAAWAADETGWSDEADREGFAVAYPEGRPPDPGKPAKFLTNPRRWFDGSPDCDDPDEQQADVRFVALMLDEIQTRLAIDRQRVFATGFSNGAGMTFVAAARLAERFAAVAPVAGHCWIESPQPTRPTPTFYLVGSDDPLVPLAGGNVRTPWGKTLYKPPVADTLAKWALAIGCAPEPTRLIESHDVVIDEYPTTMEKRRFLALTNHGLGHHWPGGKGKLSEKIGGRYVVSVNACQRIWEFFGGDRLSSAGTGG